MATFPSSTTADGIWTLKKQKRAQQGGDWPFVPVPLGDNAVAFDGDDYLKTAASSDFAFANGDFTIECWIYPTTVSGIQGVLSTRVDSGASSGQLFFGLNGSSVLYYAGSVIQGGTLTAGEWHHIACTRSSSTIKIFLNGTQVATGTDIGSKTTTFGYISAGGGDGSQLFTGSVSNARFITGYPLYTSNFTVPTSNLTALSGTILLTCQQDHLFTDNSGTSKTININGDPTASALTPF